MLSVHRFPVTVCCQRIFSIKPGYKRQIRLTSGKWSGRTQSKFQPRRVDFSPVETNSVPSGGGGILLPILFTAGVTAHSFIFQYLFFIYVT